nr:hypothetical protein [Paenibacillus xylanexedens]
MTKNRLISLAVCVVVMLSSAACASVDKEASQVQPVTIYATQDSPHYNSIDSLSEKASAIVRGRVIDTRVEAINDMIISDSKDEQSNPGGDLPEANKIYTIYTIKVDEAYKGKYSTGDTLEVKQLGGKVGNTTLVAEESADITSEKDYVFFVATYAQTPASLLNAIQGLYIYESAVGQSAKANGEATITNAHQENDLTLRVEDLSKIKAKYSN